MPRSAHEVKAALEGVFGFPVTPFRPDGGIDLPTYRRHVRFLATQEFAAIFACAGTGEYFSLAPGEYAEAVAAAVAEVGGRVPVLAGAGGPLPAACAFARLAADAGADGLLLFPPYLLQPEPEGLAAYVRAIAEATPLALCLYHRDNALYPPALVERLAAEIPHLVGFKDGHGNLELLTRVRLAVGDRLAFMNGMPTAEMTFPAFHACGVRSYSSAIGNFFPGLTFRFHGAVLAGEEELWRRILRRAIEPICRIRDRKRGYAVSYVKAAVNLVGLHPGGVGGVRPPLVDLDAGEREELRAVLDRIRAEFPAETALPAVK